MSPQGHWLVLQLAGVRQPVRDDLDPRVECRIDGDRWKARLSFPLGWLPRRTERMNAFGIRGAGDARQYCAWQPAPGPAPDFHRLDVFAPLPAAWTTRTEALRPYRART